MFLATVLMALREIWRNRLRSALTMLGVVIGVAAVIALVSIGRGATARVTEDIGKLGKNLLLLMPGSMSRGAAPTPVPAFRAEDARAIQNEVLGVRAVAAVASSRQPIVYGNRNTRSDVTGSDNALFDVRGYVLEAGRLFLPSEVGGGAPVCVIGESVRKNLFGVSDPLNASIRVGRVSCRVIGRLASKGQAGMGQDQDDVVVMPLRTFQRRISGNIDVSLILISAQEGRSTAAIADRVRGLMRQRRHRPPGSEDDVTVHDMTEIAATVKSATTSMTALLGAIAAVSLIVGGIGIMNIMLVSVTERTREIGIRLAIGAFAGEVMLQFLLEAVVLSTLGGTLGVLLGFLGSYFATRAMALPFVVAPEIVVLAFTFSALVGVLFGYLPARKAAELNPIEALRHE